ncbi:hypothetical protein, conserved [Leishmania tarentolae]|uniref:Uncharacterized protein n=1 Tax=Leishmania tarentolae TaxID=5689 RepID=A0A640KCQ5_LEITA|nr:hypothetical protein, conserved [Leishmania tarentolae]
MSAPSPEDERPSMLPRLHGQTTPSSAATPEDASSASTENTNMVPSEGDSLPWGRRAMSFEEFRQFYVASQKLNYLSKQCNTTGRSGDPDGGGSTAQDSIGADALAEEVDRPRDVVGTLRRRIVRTQEEGPAPTQTVEGTPAIPPPAAQAPPAPLPPGLLARVTRIAGGCVHWLMAGAMRNRAQLFQFLLAFFVLYVQVKISKTHMICLLILYMTVKGVQVFVQNFQISHETGRTAAPSLLGRFFKPEGHVGSVSKLRKTGYILAKCAEAFLLSLCPTYSLEHLERELCADAIVR